MIGYLVAVIRLHVAIQSLYGPGAPHSAWRTVEPEHSIQAAAAIVELADPTHPPELVAAIAIGETSMRLGLRGRRGECGIMQVAHYGAGKRQRCAAADVDYRVSVRQGLDRLDAWRRWCQRHRPRDVGRCTLGTYRGGYGGADSISGPRLVRWHALQIAIASGGVAPGAHKARGRSDTATAPSKRCRAVRAPHYGCSLRLGMHPQASPSDQIRRAVASRQTVHDLSVVARSLTRDAELQHDLVQETVVRALEAATRHDNGQAPIVFDDGDVGPWLRTILRHEFYRHGRYREVRQRLQTAVAEDRMQAASAAEQRRVEALETAATFSLVAHELNALPENMRQVLALDASGLPYRAIAAQVGIEHGTVMSRLSRAREALRQRLGAGVTPAQV